MLQRRNWLLRLSVVFNILVVIFLGAHLVYLNKDVREIVVLEESDAGEPSRRILLDIGSQPPNFPPTNTQGPGSSVYPTNKTSPATTEHSTTPVAQASIDCVDRRPLQYAAQRGDYWVLYNYILAKKQFRCWESVTYTTHADYTFLDNIETLLERWKGPISIALHAPGTDFNATIMSIRYLYDCSPQPIANLVTFHIYFPDKHFPKYIPRGKSIFSSKFNCSNPPPWTTWKTTYKTAKKLFYPVNVGRNIARESATTHYILASDIELYPSPGVINDFLEMIRRQDPPLRHKNPKVFPLSIFEIEADMGLPNDKTELVAMLKNGTAIPFHKKVCPGCHNVPHSKEWIQAEVTQGLKVFHIGKRVGFFVHWEPIYIGTHADPLYDERLSWEGKSDKMTQGYTLCVLDYEFQILDNAFLVHKPGIKTLKKDPVRAALAGKTNSLIRKVIFPELRILYGTKKGCAV